MNSTNVTRKAVRGPGRRRIGGQALTEVAIMAAIMVPLFLMVPVMAKYAHLRHVNKQMARDAAWRASVAPDYVLERKPTQKQNLERILAERHFAAADASIQSRPPNGAANAPLNDPMLNTFSNKTLLERRGIEFTKYDEEGPVGFADNALAAIEELPGDFPPNSKGQVTARMTLNVEELKDRNGRRIRYLEPFNSANQSITMVAEHTVLVDPWNAAGAGYGNNPRDRSVMSQTRSLVPTAYLDGAMPDLGGVISKVPVVGVIGDLDIGHIDPDVVPKNRLKRYVP